MISNVLLIIAMAYLLIGAIGINKLKGIFPKLLTSSLMDTAALIFLVAGLVLRLGISSMSIKLCVVLLIILFTNPVTNHMITRAAYKDDNNRYTYFFKRKQ